MEFRVFIGSSSESRNVINKITEIISRVPSVGDLTVVVRPWYNVFNLGEVAIESVEREANNTDLAIFVFAADDEVVFRHNNYMCTRDNVVFEAGLFMGKLGRKRVFLIVPADNTISNGLPYKQLSDLAGLTVIPADLRDLPGGFSREVIEKIQTGIENLMNCDPRKETTNKLNIKSSSSASNPTSFKDYSKMIPNSLRED